MILVWLVQFFFYVIGRSMKSMFKLTSGLSSADVCENGLLKMEKFGSCSVGNLSIVCLSLSMLVSVVMGIFFADSSRFALMWKSSNLCNLSNRLLCFNFELASNLSLSDFLVHIESREGC